ncbi:MAG TPA: MFS transporter [Alphaproteobacteria bacterium]|nr:MFS transporter [Alphaproteobacteria bacterium]
MNLFGTPERRLVMMVGSISFISSMIFSLVGSLAPAFQKDLHIPAQQIGTIMGAYMLSSAVSGFLGTLYLDRFDRRKALAVGLLGTFIGLLLTGLAPTYETLIAARILSGVFAGPSNSLAIATLVDNIPHERRGKALGTVSGFQALAQIVGIPAGLEITDLFGTWRAPFGFIALLQGVIAITVILNLPPQRAHLESGVSFAISARLRMLGRLLSKPMCLLTYGLQMTGVVPLVAITTIMAVWLVHNLSYPAGELSVLYLVGGGSNIISARFLVGPWIDRVGAGLVSLVSTVVMTAAILMGYLGFNPGLPLTIVFALFFITSSARLIVTQTTSMRIPKPDERAGFQSLSSSIQALVMGLSALSTSYLLGSTPDGKLTGMVPFAIGVIAVGWVYPLLVYQLDGMLNRRDKQERAATVTGVAAE